ncbi:MAG: class 1 isoprenoid biosynthesis enzyme [Ignavibacteriales bacterium]|nr:class 1 isoprenoid biosynthesis enzyme [Ignavibacteriales bacterium]
MINSDLNDFCIDMQLEKFISAWPKQMTAEFKDYYSNASWQKGMVFSLNYDYEKVPFWFILPHRILSKFVSSDLHDVNNIKFLHDSLWAQYCTFMFIRIKDDVIDSNEKNELLILISDQFLFEAEETLLNYFEKDNSFWKIFYQLLKETTQAMYEKTHLEKLFQQSPDKIIHFSGKEASVLNIGTAAVCSKCNKMKEFQLLKKMTYHLVVSRQIIDDLFDIEEDLKIGKYNYAASLFFNNNLAEISNSTEAVKVLSKSTIYSEGINVLFDDINKSVEIAELLAKLLELPLIITLIANYRIYIKSISNSFFQQRLKKIFNKN